MRCARLILLGVTLCLPAMSQGAVLTFGFEGDVTNVQDPIGVLDFVEPGQRFVYTVTFDTDAPNIYPEFGPNYAYYLAISSTASVGTHSFATTTPAMAIFDDPVSGDEFSVGSAIQWDLPELIGHKGVGVHLWGGNGLEGVAPPHSTDELAFFTYKAFSFQFEVPGGSTGELATIYGPVDSMYVVPEPVTVLMLAFAGLVIGSKRRFS